MRWQPMREPRTDMTAQKAPHTSTLTNNKNSPNLRPKLLCNGAWPRRPICRYRLVDDLIAHRARFVFSGQPISDKKGKLFKLIAPSRPAWRCWLASIGRQSSSAYPSEGHIGSLASSHAALGEPLAPLRWPDVDLLIQATHSKPRRGRSSTDPAEFSHARAWR